MANPFVHDNILMEIFLRLPAKSVGKFRCLSKTWRTHLSASWFINLHLTTRRTKPATLILQILDGDSLRVLTPSIHDARATVSSKVELSLTTPRIKVVNSCNGLVLLLVNQRDMFLLNPVTLEHVQVSASSCLKSKKIISGFGYDSCSDDYKILEYEKDDGILQVYSVKSRVWKRVSTSPYHMMESCYGGVFNNGAIHWASKDTSRIVAFSLADEVFYHIPSPTYELHRVSVIEGCLSIVDGWHSNDVWIMKEYGVVESWTKFSIRSNGKWFVYRPLYFVGDEEIVFATYDNRVIVYNLVEGTAKDMIVGGDTASYTKELVAFSDSLVSPNQLVSF